MSSMKDVKLLLESQHGSFDKIIGLMCDKINFLELDSLRKERKISDMDKVIANLVHNMQGFSIEIEDVKTIVDKDIQEVKHER